jgi:HAD superfamily hydrolase (TIGR01509 family)
MVARRHRLRRHPLIKPDPAIYAHHTESFGLDPEATLFIDDSEKNVFRRAISAGRRSCSRTRSSCAKALAKFDLAA